MANNAYITPFFTRYHGILVLSTVFDVAIAILRIHFQFHIGIRASSLVAQLTYDLDVARYVDFDVSGSARSRE